MRRKLGMKEKEKERERGKEVKKERKHLAHDFVFCLLFFVLTGRKDPSLLMLYHADSFRISPFHLHGCIASVCCLCLAFVSFFCELQVFQSVTLRASSVFLFMSWIKYHRFCPFLHLIDELHFRLYVIIDTLPCSVHTTTSFLLIDRHTAVVHLFMTFFVLLYCSLFCCI